MLCSVARRNWVNRLTHSRARPLQHKRRTPLWIEQLETRLTPSVNPAAPLELDGNVTTQTTHDWDQIFANVNTGALASSFVTDKFNNSTDDIFQGGGSKDISGIQQGPWLFTSSKPQGKDDIAQAMAAAYIDPATGHLILYAALDRFDNSGDSTAGFWFFSNNIGENPNVNQNGGHPFIGTHADGDILLVSDFTVGGSTSTIKVFRWTGNDATGHLVALNNGNPINGDTFAIVNSGAISVPWSYVNKSGQTKPAAGEFLEEGVDLTDLGLAGCFSSFLAETRSSQSPSATLSDFTLGKFALCSLNVTPVTGLSKVTDSFTYPITITNTGGMALFVQNVNDTLLGNLVVNHTLQAPGSAGVNPFVTSITSSFNFNTALAPGASLTIFVSRTMQAGDPDPIVSTTSVIGTDDLAGTADQITASANNSVNLFQPSVSLVETASPTVGVVGTPITYTYKITNTSSADSPNLILDLNNSNDSLVDTLFGSIEADAIHAETGNPAATVASIAPGTMFSFTETRAIQASDPTPLTDTVTGAFTLAQNLGNFSNVIQAQSSVTTHTVDAQVSITPDATNEIGQPHTFTVVVLQNDGLPIGAPGGDAFNGFGPASGANVTVALTNTNGAMAIPFDGIPLVLSGTTGANGQFAVEFTSATAGQVLGSATANLSVDGVSITRMTGDAVSGDGSPATKAFVDATITIAPNATNEVGQPHTFTVTVLQNAGDGNGFVAATNDPVSVTLTSINGANAVPSTPLSGTTDATGHFQVTFSSATAGEIIGNATVNLTVGGVPLSRSTGDSHVGDSGPVIKTFEDATIAIVASGVNEVNSPHTFTITVLENAGDGNGFVAAANEPVLVTLTNTNGSTTSPTSYSLTTDANGQTSVTFTSATAGEVIGNASTTFVLNGVTLTRATGDNKVGDSGPVTKVFEDANIVIAPSATNEVGNPHTFIVTVMQNAGDGNGFVAAANDPVTVTLTGLDGAVPVPSTPLSGTTDLNGQFSVSFTSATAGQVIGSATTSIVLNGVTLTRTTGDLKVGDSGTVIKTFVDAQVVIAPNATNGLTEPHTFTVTALENAGDGNGFVAAAGANVTVTLTGQNGAVPIAETPLSGVADASGHFSVTFTSDSAGQVIGNATITVTVGGVMLTRGTGDSHTGDGGPATKTFVAGEILWKKVDEAGNLLPGATFIVTATGGTAAGLMPQSVTVVDNGPFDANPTGGLFELDAYQMFGGSALTGLALGTYTIQESVAPTGYTLDPKVLTATLTQNSLVADLTGSPFVDTLPKLSIVKAATGGVTTVHPGGTASFTITVTNSGAGTANNVVMTDQLPDTQQLTWTITSFTGFDVASISSGGLVTATEAHLLGGASASVVVSALIPLNIFGVNNPGQPNGDPVPLNLFELDGNVTTGVLGSTGSTTTSHDWDQVYADNVANPKTNTAGAVASTFVSDEAVGDDIFTGGSTKDTLPVGGWLYKTAKPQDKDEITHAFAAQYVDPVTKDVILYAGLDRFDNSGDSTAGFWFFVSPVAKSQPGTVGGPGAHFTGAHTDGDILLISDFTTGGSVSTIRVFKWSGNDATGHLVALNNGNPISGSTFAIVNQAPISVPWSYTNKSGQHQPQAGEFLEEGVNLTGLGLNGCFSSFLAETRSSQSPTATLSDFILGSFSTCDIKLPNQASVKADNFNNGQPITSNVVVIDVNDGDGMAGAQLGTASPVAATSSTVQQPQTTTLATSQPVAGVDGTQTSSAAETSSLVPWHAKGTTSAWDADAFLAEVFNPILLPI